MNLSTGHWRQPNTWLDMSMCIACYCQWWGFMFRVQEPQLLPFQGPPRLSKWDFLLCMMKVTSPSLRSEVGIHISRMEVMHLVQGWCQLVVVPFIYKIQPPCLSSFCWAITCEPYKFMLANSSVVNLFEKNFFRDLMRYPSKIATQRYCSGLCVTVNLQLNQLECLLLF